MYMNYHASTPLSKTIHNKIVPLSGVEGWTH